MRKKMERLAKKVTALYPGKLYFTDIFPGGNIEHDRKYFLIWASGVICRAWKTQWEAVEELEDILSTGYL